MSLEAMKTRMNYLGGPHRQNRMIETKQFSLAYAIKNSYQAAQLYEYPGLDVLNRGLINHVIENENIDTKLVSLPHESGYHVGTIFRWAETDSIWVIFLHDRTELGYFRGRARRCDYKVQWVNAERQVLETPISIIGPTVPTLRTSSSMQASIAQDFPNAVVQILIPDNEQNEKYFTRYQTFVLKGITYVVEQIDRVSMPGIMQLNATEHYSNKIEDDVEGDLRNKWNVLPVIESTTTEYMIEGPTAIRPKFQQLYRAIVGGGRWTILENEGRAGAVNLIPAKFVEDTDTQEIHVYWDSMVRGNFTLVYTVNDRRYYRNIHVASLM